MTIKAWATTAAQSVLSNWEKLQPVSGPIRNQAMLDEGRPDLVVAFPGHHGTADIVRRARAAGIKVRQPGFETA